MKVLKTAAQRNVFLESEMYTKTEIENLAYQGYIFRLFDGDDWRVSLTMCETISVKYCKEDGLYRTVVKHIDGTELFVAL